MALSPSELDAIRENPYRAGFPLLAANPGIAYLDSAATSQRPKSVLDAEMRFYETMNANPLRGLYRLSVEATQAIDAARERFGKLKDGKWAGFLPDTVRNRSTHTTIFSLRSSGDEVVISIMEHHSNLIPWQQICAERGATLTYLYLDDEYRIPASELDKIGPRTKIVSVTQVSNVLGVENDVAGIAARAHAVGAVCVVDGAQSVPHIPVDVAELGCDFLAFSGHKMLAPMGIGVLWGKRALLEAMPPFLTGGEMIDSVSEQGAVWAPIPAKFEAGTQDGAGIVALGAAVSYLEGIGMAAVEERERLLAIALTDALASLPFIDIVGPVDGARHVGAVSFNVRGVHPHDVSSILDMSEVCIRAGHHCAEPLLKRLSESSTCRASIALYNDLSDIDRLVNGLESVWKVFNG